MPVIEDKEFEIRVALAQASLRNNNLDALLVHSNEADMANVRYFSDYWPIFESAGVIIPAEGDPALLIGPESESFARDRSRIPTVYKLIEYREPAEPDYPDIDVITFDQAFLSQCGKHPERVGIAGWQTLSLPVWLSLNSCLPDVEFVKADQIVVELRKIKSNAEVACLSKAFHIAEECIETILRDMHCGLTELQVVGIAQQRLYSLGAEYEGMPQYILSGSNSSQAISRPSSRVIGEGDIVQLNISARVSGYSSGVGRPISMGKMWPEYRELVEFGLEAHLWTIDKMKPGRSAAEIASEYENWVKQKGYGEYLLYGPCHGLGLMEVEAPWLEKTSNYELVPGMTFQADTFFHAPSNTKLSRRGCFGIRWEDGLVITDEGNRLFSDRHLEIIELGC